MEPSSGNPSLESTTDLLLLRNPCCKQQGHPARMTQEGAITIEAKQSFGDRRYQAGAWEREKQRHLEQEAAEKAEPRSYGFSAAFAIFCSKCLGIRQHGRSNGHVMVAGVVSRGGAWASQVRQCPDDRLSATARMYFVLRMSAMWG